MPCNTICPACEDEMRAFSKNGLTYEVCQGCEGMWFDFGELKEAIMLESAPNLKSVGVAKGDDKSDHEHEYNCSACDEEMEEREYAVDSGIHIDVCPECRGIFVSPADIAELRSFLHSREDNDAMEGLQTQVAQALINKKIEIRAQQEELAEEIDDLFFMDDLPGINMISEWLIDELVDSEAFDI